MNKLFPIVLALMCFGLAQEYGRLCANTNPSVCMDECNAYKLTPDPLESCNFLDPSNNYQSIKYFIDPYYWTNFSIFTNQTVKIEGYETTCTECSGIEVLNIDSFFYGDLDGDLSLNVIDAVLMTNIILEQITPTLDQSVASDINYDESRDILDIVILINEIIGNGILNQQCIGNSDMNLITFNCDTSMDLFAAIPDDIEPFITSIMGEASAATYIDGMGWIGSLSQLTPYSSYWFQVSELPGGIACFTFDCAE